MSPAARMLDADVGTVALKASIVQSLPETVQVLSPPGPWAVPGAFF